MDTEARLHARCRFHAAPRAAPSACCITPVPREQVGSRAVDARPGLSSPSGANKQAKLERRHACVRSVGRAATRLPGI